jgi:mRNA interferase YafQ
LKTSESDAMRTIRRDTQFKRDVKRMIRRNKDMNKLKDTILRIANAEKLRPKHKDHALKGTLKDCRECHIETNWLLIYRIEGSELCLVRTGTHSDLFD